MKPYPDQEKSIQEILEAFEAHDRVFFCLATGGGKTACFSFIAKRFMKKYGSKTLVLAHRGELINQTLNTLRTINVSCESVIASKKKLQHYSDCYVGMVQTLKNRLRLNSEFLKDEIGLIICDEAHLLQYSEIFEYYPEAKILAVSATPVTLKKVHFTKCNVCNKIHNTVTECCNYETYEYTRKFNLSEIYGHLIIGTSISELIMSERLVRELVYSTGNIDRSKLTIDAKTGDYDNKSTDAHYTNSSFDVVKNYEEIAFGKKTIIFNSSSKVNAIVLQAFLDKGYKNVKLFDSVNETENRKKVLEWFKNTPDAILLNVNCFTTGFDEPTLECVILNRATLSLSLYHQMIGRGGRKCDEIYKPNFIHIDLGGNIEVHGRWSDEVDWKSIFHGQNDKPRPKKEALESTKLCENCECLIAKTALECEECGFVFKEKQKEKTFSDEVAVLVDEIPLPNGKKIVEYCKRSGKDRNFAWLILQNNILDLFIRHSVTFGTYQKTERNGKFEQSIRRIIKEPYQSIQGSELECGTMRTKAWVINKIKSKLEKYYEKSERNINTATDC